MTLTEQVKILHDKIRTNKAQYDIDRQAAKISALSSKDLEKYECLIKYLKRMKKIKKVIKQGHDLIYNSAHNFNKYSVSSFNEISSTDSKFDTKNKF